MRHLAPDDALGRVAREQLERVPLLVHHLLRAVRAPLDPDQRLPERRQRARAREGQAARGRERGDGGVRRGEERAVPLQARVELVEERVVDHAEHGAFVDDEPEGDACVWEAVHEVRRAVC